MTPAELDRLYFVLFKLNEETFTTESSCGRHRVIPRRFGGASSFYRFLCEETKRSVARLCTYTPCATLERCTHDLLSDERSACVAKSARTKELALQVVKEEHRVYFANLLSNLPSQAAS